METVAEILRQKKARPLLFASPGETVLAATQRMNDESVGALLIMDGSSIVGILTERDILRRVVAEELIPSYVYVGEVMTVDVACCTIDTSIDEVQILMRQYCIRHVPVVDQDGEVLGIISIGDLNAYHSSQQEVEIRFLHEYLHGPV